VLMAKTITKQFYKACSLLSLMLFISANQATAEEMSVFDQGLAGSGWDRGINAFDEAIDYRECNNDGGAGCPSISWEPVTDSERNNVLEVTHSSSGKKAGIFIASSLGKNLSNFAGGHILFDIKVVSGDSNITMKIDCFWPCTSGEQPLGSKGSSGWETVTVPVNTLVSNNLDLSKVNTGIVVWASNTTNTVFRIDNVRWLTSGNVTDSEFAPTPSEAESEVLSIFSDEYNDVTGTEFDPNWNQNTSASIVNGELVYTNLNYQGTVFSAQDVSGYGYLHVDFYSDNSTDLGIYLIDGNNETEYEFTVTQGQWNSVDIPLTAFTGVDLSSVIQFKVEGNGTVRLDNLYFAGNSGSGNTDGGTGGGNNSAVTPVDAEKWFHQTQIPGGGNWYNNEQQHYTNRIENSHVSDGVLKIVAIKEPFTDQGYTKQFTSARLNSKYAFKYGRVVVRAKLPSGVGTWPAIWTLGKNISEAGAYWQTQGFGNTPWPECGEIDIMEHWGSDQNYVSSAMHTPSSFGGTINHGGQRINTVSTAFHNYELDWNSERIIFSVDGKEHYTYAPEDKNSSTWPYDAEQYLILNVAMQDSTPSNFTQSAMEIDYIRVYAENSSSNAQPVWSDEFNTIGEVDTDSDGIDDSVDPDDDNDTYMDSNDAFPLDSSEWLDTDGDGTGNNADSDDDNDNVNDSIDLFPLISSEWADADGDGTGDNADTDDDNDNFSDSIDAFPFNDSEWTDTDGDGTGNNADTDDDNDNVSDSLDVFPLISSEWADADGDGTGDNADTDDDNDNVSDSIDAFPFDNSEWTDTDTDGVGNNEDTDDDNDTVIDSLDAFSLLASESIDTDGDGIGDNADTDDDGDGILDSLDSYPLDADNLPLNLMDVDGNGQVDGLTDAMLVLRYIFGYSGEALVNGVVADDATRTSPAEIEAHLESLMP
jgi:beta-glucanase (GH16 family)